MPSIVRSRVALILGFTVAPKAPDEPKPRKRPQGRPKGSVGVLIRPWSDQEIADLGKLLAAGIMWPRICELLGRTRRSAQAKAYQLGLCLPPEADGRRKQKVERHW